MLLPFCVYHSLFFKMTHNFNTSLANSLPHDATLDGYFTRWYIVQKTSLELDKLGIDRIFICKATKRRFGIQYKSDSRASETGNAYVESVSVDTNGKDGWALTCLSQYLIYYIPPFEIAYLIQTIHLKEALLEWRIKYPERKSINERYNTFGVPVPLQEFSKCADKILKIAPHTQV